MSLKFLTQRNWPLILTIALVISIGVYYAASAINRRQTGSSASSQTVSGGYLLVTGTVTKYDPSPQAYDGGIIFQIDNKAYDIGGGLRPAATSGTIYNPIAVGDVVRAKFKQTESGSYTLYGCASCYVRKQ